MCIRDSFMIHEDYGFYNYPEHYYMGDIFVLVSPDVEKGVLLELKGKGCRQFENFLLAQHRSWYDFLMDVLMEGGVIKQMCIRDSGRNKVSLRLSVRGRIYAGCRK